MKLFTGTKASILLVLYPKLHYLTILFELKFQALVITPLLFFLSCAF